MPFWNKSSSSHSLQDPALDYQRSQSRQDQYLPSSPSQGSFNPYAQRPSDAGLDSSSRQNLAPPEVLQGPAPTYNDSLVGQPYDQAPQGQEPLAGSAGGKPQAGRKSIKNKILAAAANAKEEARDERSKHNLFGRRKSVRKDSPPVGRQEPSIYQQNAAQWQSSQTQPPVPGTSIDRFDSHPDYSAEQTHSTEEPLFDEDQIPVHPHQQQNQDLVDLPLQSRADHSQHPLPQIQTTHTTPYPDSPQRYDNQPRSQPSQYSQQQSHLTETPSSADSGTSPNRPSLDSLQRPPSRPDPNSRSSSRASYDPYHAAQQTGPYRAYSEHTIQDPRYQGTGINQNSSPAYQAYAVQRPQQGVAMAPPDGMKNFSHLGGGSRDSAGSLQPMNHMDQGPQNMGPGMASSPLNPKLQPVPREDSSGRALPPSRAPSDLNEADVNQIQEAHRKDREELLDLRKKYQNVKKQYFQQKEQVDTLQNALAHQRLSASRTQLDDGEYIKRMERLSGLISQLAHAIRKDWAKIPDWLEQSVNKDALQAGKQEMIAVGRAFMSRWLADEVFDKYFHPDVPGDLSAALKMLQKNMREHAPSYQGDEEKETLTAKINTWRLTTVDGLKPFLTSDSAAATRQSAIEALGQQFLADFAKHMKEQPPAELNHNIPMIVELAVGILANLPLESRDVHIAYFPPGTHISDEVMQLEETKIPALASTSAAEVHDGDHTSLSESASTHSGKDGEEKGRGKAFLGALMGSGAKKGVQSPSQQPSSIQPTPVQSPLPRDEEPARVRMCVFLELEVRGKMVLLKAPVYRL